MSGKYDRDSRSGAQTGGEGANSKRGPPWDKAHEANGTDRTVLKLNEIIEKGKTLDARTLVPVSMAICNFIESDPYNKDLLAYPLDPSRISVTLVKTTGKWGVSITSRQKDEYDSPYRQEEQTQQKLVYSLGKIMFELLVGEPIPKPSDDEGNERAVFLFAGGAINEKTYRKIADFPGSSNDLAQIISKALTIPELSFRSVAELREALAAYQGGKMDAYCQKLEQSREKERASAVIAVPPAPAPAIPPVYMEDYSRYQEPPKKNRAARIIVPIALAGLAVGAYYFQDIKKAAEKYFSGEKEIIQEIQPPAPVVKEETQQSYKILLHISTKDGSKKNASAYSIYPENGKKKRHIYGETKNGELEATTYAKKARIFVEMEGYRTEEFDWNSSMGAKSIVLYKKPKGSKNKAELNEDSEKPTSPQINADTEGAGQDTEAAKEDTEAQEGTAAPSEEQPAEDGKGQEEEIQIPNNF